ncbi:hypothetical protein LJR129_002113 [Acidovorax sp. LjRoot129]
MKQHAYAPSHFVIRLALISPPAALIRLLAVVGTLLPALVTALLLLALLVSLILRIALILLAVLLVLLVLLRLIALTLISLLIGRHDYLQKSSGDIACEAISWRAQAVCGR